MPRVAIVLPVYNTSNYLKECLDSILAQTFSDFIIYAVDDGSTDNSLEILKSYQLKDHRICVLNQKNQGVAGARNTALREIYSPASEIEYVLFFDSDDKVDQHCIETCVREIQDVDVVIYSFHRFNTNGICSSKRAVPKYEYLNHDQTCEHYFRMNKWERGNTSCFYGLFNKCFRLSTLNGRFFNTSLKICEDQDFFINLLPNIQKSKVLPNFLYFYRLRASSLTHTKAYEGFTDDFLVFKKYLDKDEFSNTMKMGIQHRYIQILWEDLQRILASNLDLSEKYHFYKQVKKFASRTFKFPFFGKDKKRICVMHAGFLPNILRVIFKSFKKNHSELDL